MEGFLLLAIDFSEDEELERYDCLECGAKNTVVVIDHHGYCSTPNCLNNEPIQYVLFPEWSKPKTCRASRTPEMIEYKRNLFR